MNTFLFTSHGDTIKGYFVLSHYIGSQHEATLYFKAVDSVEAYT